NNNAYCQDHEVSWYDWRLLAHNADLHRFVQGLIAFRRRHPTLTVDHSLDGRPWEKALDDGVSFHGVCLSQPDWSHHSHSLAVHLHGAQGDVGVYVIANAYHQGLTFDLPRDIRWRRVADTSLPMPDDLCADEAQAPLVPGSRYAVGPRSVVILIEERA
ncbi:MAG: glycogen debranching enzyme, partial [Chloroflexota bacterium]